MIRRAALALALFLLPVAGLPVAAQAASPALRIVTAATPSHLTPGDSTGAGGYLVTVTNIGSGPTDGSPITITDSLPAGVSVHPGVGEGGLSFTVRYDQQTQDESLCQAGPPVSCTITAAGFIPHVLEPGGQFVVSIPVDVDAALAGTSVIDQVTASGGGASPVSDSGLTRVGADPDPFGFQEADFALSDAAGVPSTQAGSHPYNFNTRFLLNSNPQKFGATSVAASLHDLHVTLPPGLVINPQATPVRCTEAQLDTGDCPDESAVGVVHAYTLGLGVLGGTIDEPVYNMVAPPGVAGELAFVIKLAPAYFHLKGGVNSAGEYQITADIDQVLQFGAALGVDLDLWGSPSDPSHDGRRGSCAPTPFHGDQTPWDGTRAQCPVSPSDIPFLTLPSACSGPLATTFSADSYADPGNFVTTTAQSTDASGNPVGVSGCAALDFHPSLQARPTTNLADSPSGLSVDLHVPQTKSLGQLATANLKKTVVTLPEGFVVNPSGANGLGACSAAEIGLTTPIGATPIHFTKDRPACPDPSRLGTAEVDTPLLDHPLPGAVYIAKPFDNPFHSLLALYVTVDDPQSGVVIKLAGKIDPDPTTGRLTTTFDENPQLPFEDFKLEFKGGPHGALATPPTCGTYSTTSSLTPWSAPDSGPPATPHDDYAIQQGPGGSCATSPAQLPNSPSFDAGTVSPVAGAYSPFVLNLSREDGSQRFAAITVSPPPGLLAKLAGVAQCSAAQLAQAAGRDEPGDAAAELAAPSCPAASQVGTVNVAAGAGPDPYNAPGKVYLTGPYKGAPLSLAIVTPALAGPFDLGVVVVRTALQLDPESARITAVSDPIPQILHGIPLDVRSAQIRLDRPDFTINGTSCDPRSITGSLLSSQGQLAPLSEPFQLGECTGLPFKPRLSLQLKGSTKRASNPRLIATVTSPPGDANIASAQVKLPKAAFLDNAHINTVCTRVQFAAQQCPAGSIYGKASATSPLLDYTLTGNVYLRTNPAHTLPDLLVALKGPDTQPVEIDLAGKTDAVKGALRNTFELVPDAPVSNFRLELFGGKRGLVELSNGLCANPVATVHMDAQNGKTYDTHPKVKAACGKGKHGGRDRRSAAH